MATFSVQSRKLLRNRALFVFQKRKDVAFGHAHFAGTTVALLPRMQARALHPHAVRITWLEVGERTYYLIARCAQCVVMVERQLDDVDHDEYLFEMIGTELLCAKGCQHIEHAPGSGMRPALRRH